MGATERDERARTEYRARVAAHAGAEFVIVDEFGTNINLTPQYGWAPSGERVWDQVPRNTGQNLTTIAALSAAGMGPAMVLDGATDTAAFTVYVEQVLLPHLSPGTIVVLDNLSAHKSLRIRELIEARGCHLWYVPPYSPDLSPIEEAIAKLKGWLRRVGARQRDDLEVAVADALTTITPSDARGYFTHCGYGRMAH